LTVFKAGEGKKRLAEHKTNISQYCEGTEPPVTKRSH